MWSLYVGRPCGIGNQDISISRPPKELDKLRPKKWTPSSDQTESTSNTAQGSPEYYDPVYACSDANVSLGAIMRQLSQTM
jgi:hypothetical protein